MSDRTSCNFCTLKRLKRDQRATTDSELFIEPMGFEGLNIYRIPTGEQLNRKKHFSMWLMRVGESCEC